MTLSDQGLARLHDVLGKHVEQGALPGIVALVAHGEDIHIEPSARWRSAPTWPCEPTRCSGSHPSPSRLPPQPP